MLIVTEPFFPALNPGIEQKLSIVCIDMASPNKGLFDAGEIKLARKKPIHIVDFASKYRFKTLKYKQLKFFMLQHGQVAQAGYLRFLFIKR